MEATGTPPAPAGRLSRLLTAAPPWNRIPAAIAFALLGFQIAIPWTAPHFTTADGPSHIYSAVAMRDLVLHHHYSVYLPVYTIQRALLPTWTVPLLLAVLEPIAGPENAERLFASLAVLAGFLSIAYAIGGLDPGGPRWTPVANALMQTWFLWVGYFGFFLGMGLLPLPIGYYARHAGRLGRWRCLRLALLLLLLWFCHPIPAAFAALALCLMALAAGGRRVREVAQVAACAAPLLLLFLLYARGYARVPFEPRALWAWQEFPMHVFVTAGGIFGAQVALTKVLLYYVAAGAVLLKRHEWASPRGMLALAAIAAFGMYLFMPDAGLGGSGVKIRFSWAMFIAGGMVAWTASRLRISRLPIAVTVGVLLCLNLIATATTVRRVSGAIDDYLSATAAIRPRSSFIRLYYPPRAAPERFGYGLIGRDPMFHLDALAAAQRRAVDFTDYEALSRVFPLVYKSRIEPVYQSNFWAMEGPVPGVPQVLRWLDENFPLPIDYVIVVGDLSSSDAARDELPAALAYLNTHMRPAAVSPSGLVRVYGRQPPAP